MSADLPAWLDERGMESCNQLVYSIQAERCVLFIGAGLSMAVGYPDWKGLVRRLAMEAGVPVPECTSISVSDAYMEAAQQAKDRLGNDRYYGLLEEMHGPRDSDTVRKIHLALLRTPFWAYITTNYDLVIEEAAEFGSASLAGVYYYPVLPHLGLRKRGSLFHIHGAVRDVNGASLARSIILTRRDYDDAYGGDSVSFMDSHAGRFLTNVLLEYDVLFVGFSLQDQRFCDALWRCEWLLDQMEQKAASVGLAAPRHRRLYALIGRGRTETSELLTGADVEAEGIPSGRSLRDLGVDPLYYPVDNDDHNHTELTRFFSFLQRQTVRLDPRELLLDP